MAMDDLDSWMWAEAVARQERADRLQKQFFKRATPRPRRQWEPPVDLFETQDALYVIVALPGVSDATLSELEVRGDTLFVAGDPPDLSLQPRVRDIGLSEFFRAREAIDHGYEATISRIAEIRRMTDISADATR